MSDEASTSDARPVRRLSARMVAKLTGVPPNKAESANATVNLGNSDGDDANAKVVDNAPTERSQTGEVVSTVSADANAQGSLAKVEDGNEKKSMKSLLKRVSAVFSLGGGGKDQAAMITGDSSPSPATNTSSNPIPQQLKDLPPPPPPPPSSTITTSSLPPSAAHNDTSTPTSASEKTGKRMSSIVSAITSFLKPSTNNTPSNVDARPETKKYDSPPPVEPVAPALNVSSLALPKRTKESKDAISLENFSHDSVLVGGRRFTMVNRSKNVYRKNNAELNDAIREQSKPKAKQDNADNLANSNSLQNKQDHLLKAASPKHAILHEPPKEINDYSTGNADVSNLRKPSPIRTNLVTSKPTSTFDYNNGSKAPKTMPIQQNNSNSRISDKYSRPVSPSTRTTPKQERAKGPSEAEIKKLFGVFAPSMDSYDPDILALMMESRKMQLVSGHSHSKLGKSMVDEVDNLPSQESKDASTSSDLTPRKNIESIYESLVPLEVIASNGFQNKTPNASRKKSSRASFESPIQLNKVSSARNRDKASTPRTSAPGDIHAVWRRGVSASAEKPRLGVLGDAKIIKDAFYDAKRMLHEYDSLASQDIWESIHSSSEQPDDM